MKSRSLGYLTKEGFRSLRVNKLMSFASITVLFSCLLLIGISFMLLANIDSLISGIEAQNVIMAYLDDYATPEDEARIRNDIMGLGNISSCELVTKEEAYQQVISEMDSVKDYLAGLENPLPDAYRITVSDMAAFDTSVARIKAVTGVISVRENSDLAKQLASARDAVKLISAGVIALLLIVSLFIISNTIKVTMFSRRLEISIMKSVGATNGFIRWPFMIEGMVLGFISGVLSLFATWGVYTLAAKELSSTLATFGVDNTVDFKEKAVLLLVAFVAVGVFTGIFGSASSIRKYLKERKFVDIEEV